MIVGFNLDIPGVDVLNHATARATYHTEKAEQYERQCSDIAALMIGVTGGAGQSADPRPQLEAHVRSHRERAEYFTLVAKYLVPTETYRLAQSDLTSLEFTFRGW